MCVLFIINKKNMNRNNISFNLLFFIILILNIINNKVNSFNIDTKYATVFQDPENQPGSYFGYSVALRRAAPGVNWNSWLLTGAPRANSTLEQHANLYEPGVVYQCRMQDGIPQRGSACSPLLLDSKGDEKHLAANGFSYHHRKSEAWLGASIDVEDEENGRVVTCGPRWINQFYEDTYLMNGICYFYDKGSFLSTEARTLPPLIEKKKQVYTLESNTAEEPSNKVFFYAFGGAGISAQFVESQNRSELILGAPGVFDWKGTVIQYKDTISVNKFGDSTNYNKLNVPNPVYLHSVPYLGYFGFSIGAGKFFQGDSKAYYVAGAPRAADYRGKVLLYSIPEIGDKPLDILRELVGQQMGEYFGASLCVADVTGDGLPDLIVGAPQHSLPSLNDVQPQGDEGRIYVFINELISLREGGFREMGEQNKIMGTQQHGARFGTTIVSLGDINLDGHADIAVGAPYEDDSRGAVYIYHGRKTGINTKFAQRITAREINPFIRGFGISISKGTDIDGNFYTDFAVGAYLSGHAVIFRSRPVITFNGNIKTNVERISFNASGFQATACIFFSGKRAPQKLDAKVTVQVDPTYKRAYFVTNSGRSGTFTFDAKMRLEEQVCQILTVEIKPQNQDFSKPIDLQMSAEIVESQAKRRKRQAAGDGFCKNCPVIDPNGLSSTTARVPYSTGCKDDDVCKTDLKVSTKFENFKPPLIIGTVNSLEMVVTVKNSGEPAFLSQALISLPRGMSLARVPQTCSEIPFLEPDQVPSLKCDIGNPLPANEEAKILLEIDLGTLKSGTESLEIRVKATSVGNEQNEIDNTKNITLPLKTVADISIAGKSIHSHYSIDWHNKTKIAEVISFSHIYEVRNYGPSPIEQAKVVLTLPYMLASKQEVNSFVSIYSPKAQLDGKTFSCSVSGGDYYSEFQDPSIKASDAGVLKESKDQYNKYERKKRATKEVVYDNQIPSNRTLFMNCSLPNVQCLAVECYIGPLRTSQNTAIITFQMKADLKKIENLLEEKDVLLLASHGSVEILSLPNSVQPENQKPDEIAIHTLFLGKIPDGKIQSWIIALAIALGILILLFIVLALVKMGFFRREKKSELEALKHKTLLQDEFGEVESD